MMIMICIKIMNIIFKFLVSRLNHDLILDYIENRCITFKNAQKDIILSKDNSDIKGIIFNMIKYGNPDTFLYTNEMSNIRFCSLNLIHKDPLAQKFYYKILINNELIHCCNNCIDMMIRFSNKMIYKLGSIQYKKLHKLYLLIRKSSLYYLLVKDCFDTIFYLNF